MNITSINHSLLDHLPGYIGWKTIDRCYQGANKALLEMKGLKRDDEIVGKTDEEISSDLDEDNQLFFEQDLQVLRGERICMVHVNAKTQVVFLLDKAPIIDQCNTIVGLIYHCRPWSDADIFHLLHQFDNKLNLGVNAYTVDYHQNKFELTRRECECLFLMTRGKTAKEIAILLALSKRTVESYIENIKNKMQCQNKAELLVKAVSNNYHNFIPQGLRQAAILKAL